MSRKVRSAKGTIVDFDLLAIKQQMAAQPAPTNVEAREKFIDRKLRRRKTKKNINDVERKVSVGEKINIEENDQVNDDHIIQKQYEEFLSKPKLDIPDEEDVVESVNLPENDSSTDEEPIVTKSKQIEKEEPKKAKTTTAKKIKK